MVTPSPNNFQSYYLLVDPCMVRDAANNICQSCIPAYYRSNLQSDNRCLKPTDIPVRHGIDSATMSIKPCADSNCVNCVDNYQTCTECDTANGYILVSGSCVVGVEVTLTCQPVNGSSASPTFAFSCPARIDSIVCPFLFFKLPSHPRFFPKASNFCVMVW